MPELPEVETTCRGILPHLLHYSIQKIVVRNSGLRVPVTANLDTLCREQMVLNISRRGKYIVVHLSSGYLLIHLGMSGTLSLSQASSPSRKHDHVEIFFNNGVILRYNDPRRFGLVIYTPEDPNLSPHLRLLGPEPLTEKFNGHYLFDRSRNRKQCIKSFIMDNRTVVGVGNIYATESLFLANLHPALPASKLTRENCGHLSTRIKQVLTAAIKAGGTTLKDFLSAEGKPGYFSQQLAIYGKENHPCPQCKILIEKVTIAGRSSTFCPKCQPFYQD